MDRPTRGEYAYRIFLAVCFTGIMVGVSLIFNYFTAVPPCQ